MKHWQQYNLEERLQILDITSAEKGLPRLAVEKDWWVVMVLKALSQTQYASFMSFKGGTSLSKGWSLIERFSEDIDVALKREGRFAISGTSNTQLAKARRTVRHYIVRELPEELADALSALGVSDFTVEPEINKSKDGEQHELRADTHPPVIYVNYKSVIEETSEYLLPRVKIEISCLSMDEPVEEKTIRSFISETVPEAEDIAVNFNTVIPTRTFLEKLFLLHEEFQKDKPRSYRMSRHLYDLEKIMDTPFGKDALADKTLYDEIVKHRSIFNRMSFVDYASHAPATVFFIPSEDVKPDWEDDYNALTEHFLYYNDIKLSFNGLMNRMKELLERVRGME